MNKTAKAIVLTGDGINCDAETVFALRLAGFDPEPVHNTDLLDNPERLKTAGMLAIPGGFSFADEIASGKVLALKLKDKLRSVLYDFVERGNLVIGICNGFQILVQLGLLPNSQPDATRSVSLARNVSGRFINKWVELEVSADDGYFAGMNVIHLPIRHGEGRLSLGPEAGTELIATVKSCARLRYAEDINGSFDRIAALTNQKGNVLGLMPHPEAFVRWNQHPAWGQIKAGSSGSRSGLFPAVDALEGQPHGLVILKNAAGMLN